MINHFLCSVGEAGNNEAINCDSYIRDVNTVIKLYKMEISKVRNEKDGKTHYVLVNLANNAQSRKSTLIPAAQLEYFKRILNAILNSEEKSISVTEAVNLSVEMSANATTAKNKISIGQAEELTKKWVAGHVLDVTDDEDHLVLGFVGLAEFSHFIKDHYPESYTQCPSCTTLCLRGVACRTCSSKTHIHCTGSTVADNHSTFKCLTCRTN